MGCCGASATSPGPSSRSFVTQPVGGGQAAQSAPPGAANPWRVTFRDGSVAWFSSQIVAYAEAGVNGGAVDYRPDGDPGATVIPAQ